MNISLLLYTCIWCSIYNIFTFITNSGGSCEGAFVEVRDGGTIYSPLLGRFCGDTLPSTQHGTGDALFIRYFNDITDVHTGFKAEASIGWYLPYLNKGLQVFR